MSGDFSRRTFDPKKHYSAVQKQQGRVDLDADWNEQADILQHRTQKETIDVIGNSGVPKKGYSFKIIPESDCSDLIITPGHMYVGGLLCELENDKKVTYLNQPYYPEPVVPTGSPPGSPPVRKLKDGNYLVYIDAWQREVNYHDDPHIQEVALEEADTTTRLQNVWQVKLLALSSAPPSCNADIKEWNDLITPPTGKLKAQAIKVDSNINPCLPLSGSGYRRLENQLYRVEIHKSGDKLNATYKWSRDNASVETTVYSIKDKVITVNGTGKDDVLGFAQGQWVEIISEESSLNCIQPTLFKIDKPIEMLSQTHHGFEITLSDAPDPKLTGPWKLRRWDQNVNANPYGLPASSVSSGSDWIDLEDGIQVSFSQGTYCSGDYWLIPARTATGDIEWPPYNIPNVVPEEQSPLGIKHHFCKLALMRIQNGSVTDLKDCRHLFPSLTEISAEDIGVNTSSCDLYQDAQNVQQALDMLCKNREPSCTVQAIPGQGWESVFDKIKDGEDAQICFRRGIYPLGKAAIIKNKGNLKLIGGGSGTRIVADKAEAALIFSNCKSVLVRDIYAETGLAGHNRENQTENLKGTLTFLDCSKVNIEDAELKCPEKGIRSATCITINNNEKTPGVVRILNCDMKAGHHQQGILLINVLQGIIENNRIGVYANSSGTWPYGLFQNKQFRAGIRNLMLSKAQIGIAKKIGANYNTTLKSENYIVNYMTDSSLKREWQKLLNDNPAKKISSSLELHEHILKLADRLLIDKAFINKYPAFNGFIGTFLKKYRSVGSQGITVGGSIAKDVHILNNTIEGFFQGIHVGLSQRGTRVNDFAENISILGNSLAIVLPSDIVKLQRHGIFVGNCKSLLLENNNISLERLVNADKLAIDGICIWGFLGGRLMITKNYLHSLDENIKSSFDVGIRVKPLNKIPLDQNPQKKKTAPTPNWVITWNVAPSRQNTLITEYPVFVLGGTNAP